MGSFITVKSVDVDKDFITKEITRVKVLAEVDTRRMAELTVPVIQNIIRNNTKRAGSTGKLANAMFADKIPGGWGVGNIDFLNQNAKYWRHVNFGSEAIGANWKHQVPKGAFQPGDSQPSSQASGQRWDTPGKYSFIPKKPIPPMNYIEQTIARMNEIISKVLATGK